MPTAAVALEHAQAIALQLAHAKRQELARVETEDSEYAHYIKKGLFTKFGGGGVNSFWISMGFFYIYCTRKVGRWPLALVEVLALGGSKA